MCVLRGGGGGGGGGGERERWGVPVHFPLIHQNVL